MKYLIINADDFGYSKGVNKGIIEAHSEGVVTSTSVMITRKFANEAKVLLNYPSLSVGLHFEQDKGKDIDELLSSQLNAFEKLLGRKPDHLDSHKHVHKRFEDIKKVFSNYSNKTKTPVRDFDHAHFITSFFGFKTMDGTGSPAPKNVSIDGLLKTLNHTKDGYNEIVCHPGYADNYLRENSSYNDMREKELKSLTDSKVKEFITNNKDMELCSWNNVIIS